MAEHELIPGLYLDTYIYDTFDNNVFDQGWNSDFTNNWSIVEWPSGDYVTSKGTSGENTFVAGPIQGHFDFQMALRLGPTFTGNHSQDFYIRDYNDDTEYLTCGRNPAGTDLQFDNTTTTDTTPWAFSAYDTRYIRIIRGKRLIDNELTDSHSGDIVYGYHSSDSVNWTEFSINATTGGGKDIYLNLDGAEDVGILWIKLQSHRGQFYWNVYESTEITFIK